MGNCLFFFTMPSTKDHVTFFKLIKSFEGKFLFIIIGTNIKEEELSPYKKFIKEHNKTAFYIKIKEEKLTNGLEDDLEYIEKELDKIIEKNSITRIIVDTTIGFGLYRTAYSIFLGNKFLNTEIKLDSFYLGNKGDKYLIENYTKHFKYKREDLYIDYIKEPIEDYLFKVNFANNKYNKLDIKNDYSKLIDSLLENKDFRYFFRAYQNVFNDENYSKPLKQYYKDNIYKKDQLLDKLKDDIPEKNLKKIKGKLENFFNNGEKYIGDKLLNRLVKPVNELISLNQKKYQPIYKNLKNDLDKLLININNQKIEDARYNFLKEKKLLKLDIYFKQNKKKMGFFFEDILSYMVQEKLKENKNIHSYTNLELDDIEIDIVLLTDKAEFVNIEIKTFHTKLKDFRSRIKVSKDNLGAKFKFYLVYPFSSKELELIKNDLETSIVDIDTKLPDYRKNWKTFFSSFHNYDLNKDIEIIGLDELDIVLNRLK